MSKRRNLVGGQITFWGGTEVQKRGDENLSNGRHVVGILGHNMGSRGKGPPHKHGIPGAPEIEG